MSSIKREKIEGILEKRAFAVISEVERELLLRKEETP